MFDIEVREGVLRLRRAGARWLSSGWRGGPSRGDAAYNVSVPTGFDRTDLDAYLAERRERAGFSESGPTLLTGVDLRHARGARSGSVEAVATAGVSNPAALPMDPEGEGSGLDGERGDSSESPRSPGPVDSSDSPDSPVGTVNVLVGTDRDLADGALANLLAVAVEAKTATLLAETGFPGTTTDAVVAACDPAGERAAFTGSATAVGAAARACVREAVSASLESRYETTDTEIPASVADAEHGVVTARRAEVFKP
ncbi:adenosylcobinamide amidohydrolase [Halorussus salilacus]|uniref:adenosylcobinamide amidohydrolase n=1 Tax=Halorussus salilacus TaxID=2953750 RepID=UPI00209D87BF|nr:adenosylcobinamide amidohydrolase [Halorussus salilacus]USZ69238.1 adenosylcobinamide amidohydrolase [Halorussus salilacus]